MNELESKFQLPRTVARGAGAGQRGQFGLIIKFLLLDAHLPPDPSEMGGAGARDRMLTRRGVGGDEDGRPCTSSRGGHEESDGSF